MNKICSKCTIEKPQKDFHVKKSENRINSWCKSCVYDSQKLRWKDRKRKLVELAGGKCSICGYDKNMASMHFHHLDPSSKDPEFKNFKEKPWKSVVEEISKCTLLCANCHGEIHNPDCQLVESSGHDNVRLTTLFQSTGSCPICDSQVFGTVYCGVQCSKMARRKVERPSAEELKQLLAEHTFVSVGKMFGVSDNAVRKWCKFYGMEI